MTEALLHITRQESWAEAQTCGLYSANTLSSDGFIHCSKVDQILRVAETFYKHQEDLVLLVIDSHKVKAEVRWEPGVDTPDELYPHIYGPLNLDAVISVLDFKAGSDGKFLLPHALALPGLL
jgi:uncharacterized protein (DUF952 family)